MKRRLANAWTEGFKVGAQGTLIVVRPAPPPRIHWSTEFQAGAEAAKRDVGEKFRSLETALDWYLRRLKINNFGAVNGEMGDLRKSLLPGKRTEDRRPDSRR
jgi:hypothetical protein